MFSNKSALIFVFVFVAHLALVVASQQSRAQSVNYDESKVPIFELPNPLVFADGSPVKSSRDWTMKRRPEILKLFKDHVYGSMPAPPKKGYVVNSKILRQQIVDVKIDPDSGSDESVKVLFKELRLSFSDDPNIPTANVLVLLPAERTQAVPVFLAYNFSGNHSIHPSKAISINSLNNRDGSTTTPDESSRGFKASRWPVGLIVSKGFGLVTLHYGDIDPDFDDGFKNGIHPMFPKLQNRPDNWTSIGAWAWGLHRVMDILEIDPDILFERITLVGHSRLGKTALWAGATDERFNTVISNNSGCGGAALARRKYGETVSIINRAFPHWFCNRHNEYSNHEERLPVDQHMLISLIAPRHVYIASAQQDRWADPKGEFLAGFHASPVYQLLGSTGIERAQPTMPPVNSPIGQSIGYHIRTGKHDVKRFDWLQFIRFSQD